MSATSPTQAAAEAAIRELIARANALQSDRTAFVRLHTEDVIVVNIAGRRVAGRELLDRAMAAALRSSLARVITHTEVDSITFLRPDVAVASCTKRVEDRNEDAPERAFPAAGAMSYVVVDHHGEWRIALAQTTPIVVAQ